MKTYTKTMFFLTISVLIFTLVGCSVSVPDVPVKIVRNIESDIQHQNSPISRRFEQAAPNAQTAVDSALELSKKYAALSEQAAELRHKNQELVSENGELKDKSIIIESELKQAKKELAEANELLIEMRIELNNWKTDVIGFRDELRDADKAQLETLLRILEELGGEVNTEVSTQQDKSVAKAPQSEQKLKITQVLGESNE